MRHPTYGFNTADQLTALTYTNKAGTKIGTLAYTPDADGRFTSITGTWSSSKLPSPTTKNYTYSASGALASGDRLTGGNGYSPLYNGQGDRNTQLVEERLRTAPAYSILGCSI